MNSFKNSNRVKNWTALLALTAVLAPSGLSYAQDDEEGRQRREGSAPEVNQRLIGQLEIRQTLITF